MGLVAVGCDRGTVPWPPIGAVMFSLIVAGLVVGGVWRGVWGLGEPLLPAAVPSTALSVEAEASEVLRYAGLSFPPFFLCSV